LDTKILIVEDEVIVAKNIENQLINNGYKVTGIAVSGEESIISAGIEKPDIVLMDIRLKGKMDGIEAADQLRKTYGLPVIFLTSYTDEETFHRAKLTEPFGYLVKPFDIKELSRAIEIALYKNETERKLQENQRRYEIAVEAGKTGVWEFWINEKKYFSDNKLKALYGFNEDELSDNLEDWSALVHEEDRREMSESFNKFLRSNEKEFRLEHRIYRKDGSVGWVIDRGILLQPDNNKPLRLIGTTTDITDKKTSEIALIESEKRFRNIFENSGIGMAVLELNGRLIKVNRSFIDMIGYAEEELIGMSFRDITYPDDIEKSVKLKQNLLEEADKENALIEKRYVHKNGNLIWALTNASVIRNENGTPIYCIAQIQNITERKNAEEQLLKYAGELKTLNSAKDKFFSIISHDLRSPFNALLGITEYVSQSFGELSPEEIRDSFRNVYTSSQKLYNLILNLLEWSRLQTGRFEIDKTAIEVFSLVEEVKDLYKENARMKNIHIESDVPAGITIHADRYMMETIMRNLVSNAIKFTPFGGWVTIESFIKDGVVEISVNDNGTGISRENLNKLFRIDEQYRTDGTADEKGSGLGLILCKEFVEKNNGTISAESEEGKGSRFTISLPLYRKNK
jgi:PAS domain S-box-containing protein